MSTSATNLDFIRAFSQASASVLESFLGEAPQAGEVNERTGTIPMQNINITVGIVGDLSGQVIFGMSRDTAMKIAATMMMEDSIEQLDEDSLSALSELGNMIAGNARSHLGELGINSNITPPSLILGESINMAWHNTQITTQSLTMNQGVLTVTLGLQNTK